MQSPPPADNDETNQRPWWRDHAVGVASLAVAVIGLFAVGQTTNFYGDVFNGDIFNNSDRPSAGPEPTTSSTEPAPPTTSGCVTDRDWSFTGGVGGNGNGYGDNIGCPTGVLRGNGNESAERFRVRFENCNFDGTLTVTGNDGTSLSVNNQCQVSNLATFPTPETNARGLTLTLTDPNGSYRVFTHASE